MADIMVAWDPASQAGDWVVSGGTLALDASIRSFVIMQLFTDAVAPPDWEAPPGDTDRRGWWGDSFSQFPIGSDLWTFVRAKKANNPTNLLRAVQGSIQRALQPLLTLKVAAAVDVACRYANATFIRADVTITKPSGTQLAISVLGPWTGI